MYVQAVWVCGCVPRESSAVESPPHPKPSLRSGFDLSPQAGRGKRGRRFLCSCSAVVGLMLLIVEQFLNGLQFGLLLFLLAAGLTLVFGIMDFVNTEHG